MRCAAAILVLAMAATACTPATTPSAAPESEDQTLRYVALGDSYTIGTGVSEAERWPDQLVARLAGTDPALQLVANLGVNGYTSQDLIRDELPRLAELEHEFVTVLIGVNDVVRGVPEATYAANVAVILDELLARLPADRLVCVATPDYTVTPEGAAYGDPGRQSESIAGVNEVLQRACAERDIRFVPEIFEISRGAGSDATLVAADGLHPSGAQYALWVDTIAPVVEDALQH